MTKKSTQLLRQWIMDERIIFWFNIGPSSFPMGTVLVDGLARVRLCGFALAFVRLAKTNTSVFNANSSDFVTVSCSLSSYSLSIKSVTNLFNPSENCLCSILISTPNLLCRWLVVTSNTGPILVSPQIQPFGPDDFSSLGRVYSRHVTGSLNCENSSVSFVMKYCPTSTVVRNPASVQILITHLCCESLSTRSWYFCKDLLVQGLRSKV